MPADAATASRDVGDPFDRLPSVTDDAARHPHGGGGAVPDSSLLRRRRSWAALRAVSACSRASAATLAWSSRPRGCCEPVEGRGDIFLHAREVVLDARQAGGQFPALADLHLNPVGDFAWHPRVRFATHMRLNAQATPDLRADAGKQATRCDPRDPTSCSPSGMAHTAVTSIIHECGGG